MAVAPDETAVQLHRLRADLQARIDDLARPPELGASQGFGKRIGDGTTEAISRLTEIGVGGSLETRLARVERALDRLEAGAYGICESCLQDIDPRRLAVAPESVLCVDCARAAGPGRGRRR